MKIIRILLLIFFCIVVIMAGLYVYALLTFSVGI